MDGIAAGGGPIDGGAECVRRGAECVKRGAERLRRWPRLKHVVAVMMGGTRRRFPSDRVGPKADRQSDRSDKAFDHGPMLLIEKRRTSPGVCSNPYQPHALEGRKGRLAAPPWELPSRIKIASQDAEGDKKTKFWGGAILW